MKNANARHLEVGVKRKLAMRRSRLAFGYADIAVLRSLPPWVFRFQKKRSFRNSNSVYSVIPKPE